MALSTYSTSSDSDSDLEVLAELSDWDRSDSSDGEEVNNVARTIKRVNYMQTLDDADFTFRFRMTKTAVNLLLTEIMPSVRVTTSRNHGVAPLHQLLLTLRFYALGTLLSSVADFIGVSKSTAGRIVRDISSAIADLYDKYIFIHTGSAEKFYEIARFPRVLGIIDCTHIRMHCPYLPLGEVFRNRYGYFSLNIQVVCDADLKFMSVIAHWPGSTQDAAIFNNSSLLEQCETGLYGSRLLLGDSAYPNRRYLLTPILNPRSEPEQRYNEAHSQTRNTIERTLGALKRRFPILGLTIRVSLPVVQTIVMAATVLHNICRTHNIVDVAPEVHYESHPIITDDINQNFVDQDIQTRADLITNYFT